MVRKYLVITLVGFILSSCAQVGVISGGEVDVSAPQPIAEKIFPKNETVHFNGNSVVIPFNEYFKLVNPLKNIQIIPPHASLTASVQRKTLQLKWKDTLEPNTTYAIYLNNAIKDLTEGNDTIIQYVFSTGAFLDSLSYSVGVVDAGTGEPINECIVGLYQPKTNKLMSFTTPKNGMATFNYLRPGQYQVIAFVDDNGDLKAQPFEKIGFIPKGTISLDSSSVAETPLRMYAPAKLPKITTVQQLSPCLFEVEFNAFIESPVVFSIDGRQMKKTDYQLTTPNKGQFKLTNQDSSKFELVVSSNNIQDTITHRLKPLENPALSISKNIKLLPKVGQNKIGLTLNTNGWLEQGVGVDTARIYLINSLDSSIVKCLSYSCTGTTVTLDFPYTLTGNYLLVCKKGAFTSCSVNAKSFEKTITFNGPDAYGEIILDLSNYENAICLKIMRQNKLVQEKTFAKSSEKLFHLTDLLPGKYTFKVVRDNNENGRWDVGNYEQLIQPEPVDIYSKETIVRAGWSINLTLSPKTKEDSK